MLMFSILAGNQLHGMNGIAEVSKISTSDLNGKISEIWADDTLATRQKVEKLQLYLGAAGERALAEFYASITNPVSGSASIPLDEALNAFESHELFKVLLAFKANPEVVADNGGVVAEQARLKPDFKKAIEYQKIHNHVAPIAILAIYGEDEAQTAAQLKKLVETGLLSQQNVHTVLDDLAIRKEIEMERYEDVSLAFEAAISDKPYAKMNREQKKALLRQRASLYDFKYLVGAALIGAAVVLGGQVIWKATQNK